MAERLPAAGPGALIEQLAHLQRPSAITAFLRRHRQLQHPGVVDLLYDEVVLRARIDLRQADRLARVARRVADLLKDDACLAQSYRAAGHVLFRRGRYEEALAQYEAALELFRRIGRENDVGRTLSGALQTLSLLGRYDQAFSWAEQAREIFERQGDRLRVARLQSNLGNILYRQERVEEALSLYETAHEELARAGQPQDVAAVLSNIAVCHITLNRFDKALETHDRARRYCEAHGLPLLVVQADYNIAYLYYLRGEYSRALELYAAAAERCGGVGDRYHLALCDLDTSEMYLELNLSGEASARAERARDMFAELGIVYERAKAMTNQAIALSHENRPDRALKLFDEARRLFAREGNDVWLAVVDFYQAMVLYREARYLKVRHLCDTARDLFTRAGLPARAAACDVLLASLELQTGQPEAAETTCELALERLKGLEAPALMCRAYTVLGLVRESMGDRPAAFASFQRAHEQLERMRSHLQAEDLKVAFLKDKLAVYESLVTISLDLEPDRPETAFGYIEQAKSRSLADLIAFRAVTLAPRVDDDTAADVRRLREDLNWHYRQIELHELRREKNAAPRVERLRDAALGLEHRLVKTLDQLRTTDREFSTLQEAGTLALDEIRAALPEGTVLLEYFEARGRIYACVATRDRLQITPVTTAATVRRLLRLLQFQLSKFRFGPTYTSRLASRLESATRNHLEELYRELVGPVRDQIDGEHVVVVPHGALHYLPFHALFDGSSFLIDQFTMSYAPSASVYRLCCAKTAGSGPPLVMGVPDPLTPHIADEVEALGAALPGSLLFRGEEATAARLREHGASARFIHIATHGLFRRDNPMFSSIRLGDGHVSLFDFYQMRLSAELVTLSGCSTGLNVVVAGDELLGLVRGLLYAGAQTVLLTLWDAYDRSTADYMQRFYAQLNGGGNKAKAFQAAIRELRSEYAHPFYWAPFALIGRAGPIENEVCAEKVGGDPIFRTS
jgi:CHAT domain-containing protein